MSEGKNTAGAAEFLTIGIRTGKCYAARETLRREIERAREEMKTAGPIHRRDLQKHIKRMETQLKVYDRYRRKAAIREG